MGKKHQVFLCVSHKPRVFGGGCCNDKGSETLIEKFKSLLEKHKLTGKVELSASSCLKNCLNGPSMLVLPGRGCYGKLQEAELEEIIEQHTLG